MKTRHRAPRLLLPALLAAFGLALSGCADYVPGRALSFSAPSGVLEGQRSEITVTFTNVHNEPIIPISMALHVRRPPLEYSGTRQVITETDYLKPLMAAEIRDLRTLNRIEADLVGDDGHWTKRPDSRYLHPRILLPGQTLTETFACQTDPRTQRLLAADFLYYLLSNEIVAGRLYARHQTQNVPPTAEHKTDVYTRIDAKQFTDPSPQPENYLIVRPLILTRQSARLISERIPLNVQPRQFSYEQALRKARPGASASAFFTPAGAWAFQYPDDGTCFVGAAGTIAKLAGHYVQLVSDAEARGGQPLAIAAPRRPDDKLLALFQKLGYSDPKATDNPARATIPPDSLISVLQQAESLGYTLDSTTWYPTSAPPPAPETPPAKTPAPGTPPAKTPAPPTPPTQPPAPPTPPTK
jgi:hypothetical protein